MDWIINSTSKAISTIFHSFILNVVQFVIESNLLGYIENINDQINHILNGNANIQNYLNHLVDLVNDILKEILPHF